MGDHPLTDYTTKMDSGADQQSPPNPEFSSATKPYQTLPFDPTVPEQNTHAAEANNVVVEHKEEVIPNGTLHLPSITSFEVAAPQEDIIPTLQPVLAPTLTATTDIREPITTGGMIPETLNPEPVQQEVSDLRHTIDMIHTLPPVTRPPVNEAPKDVPVIAPASAPISALLDPEQIMAPVISAPEPVKEPTPVPQVTSEPSEPVTTPNLSLQANVDAMEVDEPSVTEVPASTDAPIIPPPVSQVDEPMEDAEVPQVTDALVRPSVETPSETPKQESIPPLEIQTSLPVQPKVSHPRDEEELDAEPASKRVKADENITPALTENVSSSAIVDTPTAIETPVLPQTSPKPPSRPSSRPTSRAGSKLSSRANSKASTPVPASATTSLPPPPPKSGGTLLPAPAEREHIAEWDQPITVPQKKHLQRGIQNAKKGHHAGPFSNPVDPVLLNIPTYFDVVKKPMDLKTIDNKLKNNDYNTVNEFLADFDVMVNNSIRFNGPDHAVSQHGIHLRHAIDRNVSNLPSQTFVEPNASEKKAKKIAETAPPKRRESRSLPSASAGSARSPTSTQTFALKSDGVPLIRRDSTVQDGRPRREIHPPAPKDLPYSSSKPKRKKFVMELKFCEKVYEELMKPKYAHVNWPFLAPVDPVALNIPQYLKIIKKPMDMQTIGQKLKNGEYENAKEFEDDFHLMIANCLKFNPADHPINAHGKEYESYFDEEWKGKAKWLKEHTPRSADQSPQSSDEEVDEEEEEEEEVEEEDPNAGQLAKLQETLALVSAQINSLTQTQQKKKSPPADKKKSKTKPTKKDSKKSAPSKSSKKSASSASKKKETQKAISWEDKMSLSDRINDLSPDAMTEAMEIIRKGMPGLGGQNDEELELDIDELPPSVLLALHNFVNSKSSKPTTKAPVATHTSSASTAKPKKNRPMKKEEQEAKIRQLKNQLGMLSGSGPADGESAGESSNVIENDDSSGDDDDSEESEED